MQADAHDACNALSAYLYDKLAQIEHWAAVAAAGLITPEQALEKIMEQTREALGDGG